MLQAVERTESKLGTIAVAGWAWRLRCSAPWRIQLVGCGVRGSLEAPPQEKTETGDAVPGHTRPSSPHKPSILDPLIR